MNRRDQTRNDITGWKAAVRINFEMSDHQVEETWGR